MIRELGKEETGLAYAAMLELRPRIGNPADFVQTVNEVQRPEGYRLVGSFADGDEQAAAAAGFREAHFLAWGHCVYVDDLSARPTFRRQGHAGMLLDWLLEEARRLGCQQLHLDSGVGPDRQDAHRLYLNRRLRISSHHFQIDL
ncbi:MAG: GNAT family N-acetyltransferase [Candidatus Dormibacteraeota bacterium]|nr:GNAT family N-acetyltransferase [Candidatus Dormibacteraeota bacterium]